VKPSVFIIAEAGVNHNGSLELAHQLIDVAAEVGADAIKFQTFKAEEVVTAHAPKAQYQIDNTQEAGSQLDMVKKLELRAEDHQTLVAHCQKRGIAFMSTAFDAQSLVLLAGLNMPAIKIPSGDITCGPLLLQAAQLRQKLMVSTGMCSLSDIERALAVIAFGLLHNGAPTTPAELEAAYCSEQGQQALQQYVTLLHCVTQYPAPMDSINLRAMDSMRQAFRLPVGYSDHTLGIEIAIAAAARGATVIEKHFTLDRTMPGPDHLASLEPAELEQLVSAIRHVEQALGNGTKQPAAAELPNRTIARRSIVAATKINQGETLAFNKLAFKRPGNGISPMHAWFLSRQTAQVDYQKDDLIML